MLAALTTGKSASAFGHTVKDSAGNMRCSFSAYRSASPTVSTNTCRGGTGAEGRGGSSYIPTSASCEGECAHTAHAHGVQGATPPLSINGPGRAAGQRQAIRGGAGLRPALQLHVQLRARVRGVQPLPCPPA